MPKPKSRIKNGFIVVTVPKQRDYAAEYVRRIARWLKKGFSKSQARGHPKPNESTISTRKPTLTIDDGKLQRALQVLRKEKNLAVAARTAHVSPERLKRAAASKRAIQKLGRRWVVNPDLPRRMPIYSRGRQIVVTVGDFASASLIGRYNSAINNYRRLNDRKILQPFVGQSVTDISGKSHPLETNPNTLYRLGSAGGETFEQVYRIVV
jgi:hypothetical protein